MGWILINPPPPMTSVGNALDSSKTKAKKIFYPSEERVRLAELERETVRDLVCRFPENEHLLRQDVRNRFQELLKRESSNAPGWHTSRRMEAKLPEDPNWFEVEGLFENEIRRAGSFNPEEMAKKLGYSVELLREVMICVGKGETFETKQSASAQHCN